jgi:hypothetical protein
MEYFIYDYRNVKSNLEFTNYDRFITNFKTYKYYLFDLSLLKSDPKTDEATRSVACNIINKQKLLFLLPYVITGISFFHLYQTNVFKSKIYLKEFKTVRSLFMLVLITRIIQKGLLKYEGDKILIETAKNKNHTI